ncbi:MAG: recombinase family protein [Clostridiales bacterium]|nr:recombinase family protein [Clostridiales bacterium]
MPIAKRVVKEIPALNRQNVAVISKKENVTYYARVSTENEEQEDSYERQKEHFEQKIKACPEWNYVEGYSDWGVTGTNAEARKNFMRMIADCRAGKINKILVKSISRFGRNTVDTLKYIRELKELGISIYFETQNIDTLTPGGEVLITILAAMAEQESRTMSTNIKWAYQKRFKDGNVLINYTGSLGYTKENDEYIIVEKEAEIIRRIYREYLTGKSLRQIAEGLNEEGITTKRGYKWHPNSIEGVLDNERYTGNAILGKSFKADVLSKSRQKNEGQAPMYYVENSHPAIISQEIFDMAKAERLRRVELRSSVKTGNGRYSSRYPFSGLLVCSKCGGKFRRFGRKIASGEFVPTWICVTHQKHPEICDMLPIKERDLENAYKTAVERFLGNVEEVNDMIMKTIEDEILIERETDLTAVQQSIEVAQQDILELFQRRRRNEITIDEYEQQYTAISTRVVDLQEQEDNLKANKVSNQIAKRRMDEIRKVLQDDQVDYMDGMIMRLLLNDIKIINKKEIEFQFESGVKILLKV